MVSPTALVSLVGAVISLVACDKLRISGNQFTYKGQHVFLSGGNLPWIAYAYDFGNNQWQYRRAQAEQQFRMLRDAGGNSIRLWIHIQGETSPQFDGNGYVIGTDAQGTFINDFRNMLDLAKEYNLFAFPTLWNAAVDQDNSHRLDGLIVDYRKLQSYIDRVLTPLVNNVKNHPALGGWDIINEVEGMIITGTHNGDKCLDTTALTNSGAGWSGQKYNYNDALRFINWQAAAIHSADPEALVTVGAWNPRSNTDQFGQVNHYTDDCLVRIGGKGNGKLDFWQFHSYSWNGAFDNVSPFVHSASNYQTNKPIVVGEFMQKQGGNMNIDQLYEYVYDHGYAGAWCWDLVSEGNSQRGGITHIKDKTNNGGIHVQVS